MSLPFSGILETDAKRFGFVRKLSPTLARTAADPFVPPALMLSLNLRTGAYLHGTAVEKNGKSPEVTAIDSVNGLSPGTWKIVKEFSQLEVVSPDRSAETGRAGKRPCDARGGALLSRREKDSER